MLGLRLRSPAYTLDHVQLAGGLLVQSLALRNVQVQAAQGTADGAGHRAGTDDLDPASDTGLVNGLLNAPVPGPGLDGAAGGVDPRRVRLPGRDRLLPRARPGLRPAGASTKPGWRARALG